jgi:hypothetical protein
MPATKLHRIQFLRMDAFLVGPGAVRAALSRNGPSFCVAKHAKKRAILSVQVERNFGRPLLTFTSTGII